MKAPMESEIKHFHDFGPFRVDPPGGAVRERWLFISCLIFVACETALDNPATLSIARHLGVPYNQRHYAFAAYTARAQRR